MPQNTPDSYSTERSATYDRIIAAVDKHVHAVAPMLIVDIHTMAPGAVRQSAEREAWELLGKGLRHLKSGAPNGEPGMFTTAVTKASLRNSSIAAGYNVEPPHFEAGYLNVEFDNGVTEAVFYARRLVEACDADLNKSTQMLQNKIATADVAGAFGAPNAINDAELSKIFDAVKKGGGGELPAPEQPKGPSKEDIAALRRQAMMTLTFLKDAYAEAGKTLKQEIDSIVQNLPDEPAPKKPKNSARSFDL